MGQKLDFDPNDPFFEPEQIHVAGIAGSCYCCNQQIHVDFQEIEELPLAKINMEHYYVYLCDQCEDDIRLLNAAGIPNVSYDVLWVIQEPLENELARLDEENGGITSIEREDLLIKLYQETARRLDSSGSKYLEKLIGDNDDTKRKDKK